MYWKKRYFKTLKDQNEWIEKNKNKYRIDLIFINNGYGIEYKKLVKI